MEKGKKMKYDDRNSICRVKLTINNRANHLTKMTHGKNDFAKGFKILLDTDLKIILLDTDLKIILLDHQKNCWNLKNNEQCYKKF